MAKIRYVVNNPSPNFLPRKERGSRHTLDKQSNHLSGECFHHYHWNVAMASYKSTLVKFSENDQNITVSFGPIQVLQT